MSTFWDKYLAPGDIRRRQEITAAAQSPNKSENALQSTTPPVQRIDASHRARRKNGLFFGGLMFAAFSLIITRRALVRRRIPMKTFDQSNAPPVSKVEGPLEAAEALGLATLNVFSFAMLAAGGAMQYFDIADLEDIRQQVRKGAGMDQEEGDTEADNEIETWIAEVLSKKDSSGTLRDGVQQKFVEIVHKKEAEIKARRQEK